MNVQKIESLMAIHIALSKRSAEYIEPKKPSPLMIRNFFSESLLQHAVGRAKNIEQCMDFLIDGRRSLIWEVRQGG